MLRRLLCKLKGIDPFYEDVREEQIALYQHFFERVIASIDVHNNTAWARGEPHDRARLNADDETMETIIGGQAEREGLSGCYLQIMANQYFFADPYSRERDKREWVKRVMHRRSTDYFPDGWATFSVIRASA